MLIKTSIAERIERGSFSSLSDAFMYAVSIDGDISEDSHVVFTFYDGSRACRYKGYPWLPASIDDRAPISYLHEEWEFYPPNAELKEYWY